MTHFARPHRWFSAFARPLVVVAIFFLLSASTHGRRAPDLEHVDISRAGYQHTRAYFSEFPFERIDMVTGDLTLTFSNLVLPGNAGLDLALSWTWTSGGVGDGCHRGRSRRMSSATA
jgi:hypothetical protein